MSTHREELQPDDNSLVITGVDFRPNKYVVWGNKEMNTYAISAYQGLLMVEMTFTRADLIKLKKRINRVLRETK